MRVPSLLRVAALLAIGTWAAWAQGWDPAMNATGWARFDKDGSCVFHNASARQLVTWSRDLPVQPVDLSRLEGAPEFWALDSAGNAWVVSGTTLQYVEKNGRLGSRVRLPATVADLAWDPRGLVLSYRAPEPYLEKREFKGGGLVWSWGNRPDGRSSAPNHFRIDLNDVGDVIMTRGDSLAVEVIEGSKGKPSSLRTFAWKDAIAPRLQLSGDRGPLSTWMGRNIVLAAVPGSQIPQAGMTGLLLARLDLDTTTLTFLPTGFTEDFSLVGVFEDQAAFLSPKGGLAFVAIQ